MAANRSSENQSNDVEIRYNRLFNFLNRFGARARENQQRQSENIQVNRRAPLPEVTKMIERNSSVSKYKFRETDDQCSICRLDFKRNHYVRILRCHHQFHKDCIDTWLLHGKSCPICRSCIQEKENVCAVAQ